MASTSRGALPPKWNGSLFSVEGDERQWGSQFWIWTTETSYFPLYAADAIDLTDTFFNMYRRQLPAAEQAAKQRWGAGGAYYPETTPFSGPVLLPKETADEFRNYFLGKTKYESLSKRTRELCWFDSSLYVVVRPGNPQAPFTWISHLASSGNELAMQAWWRYRYTGDKQWLRSHAYPMLRGVAEFYRHLLREGEDGRLHLDGTNQHEAFWGVNDGQVDLAAIRGTTPLAVRAAEILDVDPDLRAKWKDLLDRLVPYPAGDDPRSKALSGGVLAADVWSIGHLGKVNGTYHHAGTAWGWPVFPFEDWTLGTRDAETDRIVQKIADLEPGRSDILAGKRLATAVRTPIVAARLGRRETLPLILASYYQQAFAPLPNGMSLFEGATAQSIEHIGCISMALNEALIQSVSARPGGPEFISLFPACPKTWTASYSGDETAKRNRRTEHAWSWSLIERDKSLPPARHRVVLLTTGSLIDLFY